MSFPEDKLLSDHQTDAGITLHGACFITLTEPHTINSNFTLVCAIYHENTSNVLFKMTQAISSLTAQFIVIEISLSEKTAIAKFPHKRTHAKNDNRCAISTKNELLFQNILTFYCLNEKKKDIDKAETSYDLTITVKLLTVNRAHRLRKIPYTKSKFHSFL